MLPVNCLGDAESVVLVFFNDGATTNTTSQLWKGQRSDVHLRQIFVDLFDFNV